MAQRYLRIHSARQSECRCRVVNGIYESALQLSKFPELGYRYHGSRDQVRILLYGHYRIAYLIRPDGNIDVLGVFHGALNIDE